jgi:hypothetical protein
MKFETKMCHSQLLSMLWMPEEFARAVDSYTATAPDMQGEGFNGYMEVKATFYVKELKAFTDLWHKSYVYPSDRATWYHVIKNGIDKFKDE